MAERKVEFETRTAYYDKPREYAVSWRWRWEESYNLDIVEATSATKAISKVFNNLSAEYEMSKHDMVVEYSMPDSM